MVSKLSTKYILAALSLCLALPLGANAAQITDKFSINLDERFLWGEGIMNFKAMNPRIGRLEYNHLKVVRPTVRSRIYGTYKPDKKTEICVAGEDYRYLYEHQLDKHMQFFRSYIRTHNDHWRFTAGRFGWDQGSGNVMDTTLDGLRLTTGPHNSYIHTFVGRLGKGPDRREGYIIEGVKKWHKWNYTGAYYNVHKDAGEAQPWSKQKIVSNRLTYHFNNKLNASYEHLWSEGNTRMTNLYGGINNTKLRHENGYVLRLVYGGYDYTKKDSYRLKFMYYHQPQSSIISHTMNGFPGLFDGDDMKGGKNRFALGMKGFGFNYDWIIRKGLLFTMEAYNLRNIHSHKYFRDVHQQVIGASLTFVM